MNATIKTTEKKQVVKRNTTKDVLNAIESPKLNLLTEVKKNTKDEKKKGIQFNYANNVNGLNALINLENQSLGFQLSKIIEVFNTYNTRDEITFTKNVKKVNKETKEVIIEAKQFVIKFCPIQESLIRRMKKDSNLYKYFASICKKTKSGGYNLYYTLQSVNKYQKELQEFTINS
jgi:hypothetical protein